MSKSKFRIAMFFSGFCMGLVGLFVANLPNSVSSSFMRGFFGTIFILLVLILRGKTSSINRLKSTIWLQLIAGITSSLTVVCYFYAIVTVGTAVSAFLLYTGGVFALIFSRIILKEKIEPLKGFAFSLALIGVAVILEPWKGINLSINLGVLFAIAAGAFLGAYIVVRKLIYRKMNKIDPTYKSSPDFYIAMVLFPTGVLCLIMFPIALPNIATFTWQNWLIGSGLGLISTAIPFSLYNIGLQGDEGGDVVILSYVEPIVASLVNIFLFGGLGLSVVFGGLIILGANIVILFGENKKSLRENKKSLRENNNNLRTNKVKE